MSVDRSTAATLACMTIVKFTQREITLVVKEDEQWVRSCSRQFEDNVGYFSL